MMLTLSDRGRIKWMTTEDGMQQSRASVLLSLNDGNLRLCHWAKNDGTIKEPEGACGT